MRTTGRVYKPEIGILPIGRPHCRRVVSGIVRQIGRSTCSTCARAAHIHRHLTEDIVSAAEGLLSLGSGGRGWIRTTVGVSQRVYSASPLAARAPVRRARLYRLNGRRLKQTSGPAPDCPWSALFVDRGAP
jgi:hypothetical protein